MKKRVFAMLCAACLLVALLFSCQTNRKIIMDPQSVADERGDIDVKQDTDEPPDIDEPTVADEPPEIDNPYPQPVAIDAIKIALITMDGIDNHWIALNEGAQQAATELGVTVTFMTKNVRCPDILESIIKDAVTDGYQAIMISPTGDVEIPTALNEAQKAGVKIIYVDNSESVPAEATFTTNNRAAGKIAGEQVLAAFTAGGISSGEIGIVDVNAVTDPVVQRNAGFRETFEGSGFTVLETEFCDGDASVSYTITKAYIDMGVVGIFGTNEGSTVGIGNAIMASGDGSIIGVGFDKSDTIMALIDDGWLFCTIAQNPEAMGYEGVKAAVAALSGESLGGIVVDTGVSVIMKTV